MVKVSKNRYYPFIKVKNTRCFYDILLKKDGVTCNIINKTIVSFDGAADVGLVEELTKELCKMGFVDKRSKRHD